jgi:hypothetical protein
MHRSRHSQFMALPEEVQDMVFAQLDNKDL